MHVIGVPKGEERVVRKKNIGRITAEKFAKFADKNKHTDSRRSMNPTLET